MGAKLAIISDSIDEEEEDVIMVDMNNQGDYVNIPTYMISHQDGQVLYKAIEGGQDVVIKYSLEIATSSSNVVPYQLWYSGVDDFYSTDGEYSLNEVLDVYH